MMSCRIIKYREETALRRKAIGDGIHFTGNNGEVSCAKDGQLRQACILQRYNLACWPIDIGGRNYILLPILDFVRSVQRHY